MPQLGLRALTGAVSNHRKTGGSCRRGTAIELRLQRFSTEPPSLRRVLSRLEKNRATAATRGANGLTVGGGASAGILNLDRAIVVASIAVADVEVVANDREHHRVHAVNEQAVFDRVKSEV